MNIILKQSQFLEFPHLYILKFRSLVPPYISYRQKLQPLKEWTRMSVFLGWAYALQTHNLVRESLLDKNLKSRLCNSLKRNLIYLTWTIVKYPKYPKTSYRVMWNEENNICNLWIQCNQTQTFQKAEIKKSNNFDCWFLRKITSNAMSYD